MKKDIIAFWGYPRKELIKEYKEKYKNATWVDLDIEPLNANEVKKNVVPDAKQEGKKVIGLFLKTMMAVAFCAIILYVILVFVKKFYGSAFALDVQDEYEELNLSSPETKEEALKSFLNRTKF